MRNVFPRLLKIYALPAVLILVMPVLAYVVDTTRKNWVGWAAICILIGTTLGFYFFMQERERQALEAKLTEKHGELNHVKTRLQEAVTESAESRRRLDLVLSFNRRLVEAQDERALMESALGMINELTGALGCSYVPVDEWEQPLPPFTSGQLPEPVLRAWALHLSGSMLRERCGECEVLKSTAGGCPLHPESVGNSMKVYCLPLTNSARQQPAYRLGILNLYLPAGRELDEGGRVFLEGVLQEIALAIEAVHLRDQEMSTLRQIQMLHSPDSGLRESLGSLIEGLQQALGVDFVMLRLRPSSDEWLSRMNVQRGTPPSWTDEALENVFNAALSGEVLRSPDGNQASWVAYPMRLPEGKVPGILWIASCLPLVLNPRQEAIIQTVAAQAALLVENERMLRSFEYKAVIQERNRLAREIHDGLAQTLAFLKLQAAQMQTYLDKGDLTRLAQVLKDNYQALAEAYLDTRQSIDNLRITPREDLEIWLDQFAGDFETTHGLRVERNLQPLSLGWRNVLSPEFQAQMIRIVQESLSNVRKHAGARNIVISLFEWQGNLVLEIKDDGRGFDAEDVPEVSQHGLRGIRERAELIGADFQIVSQARQGTTVRLVLPEYLKEGAR